MKGSTDLSYK
jgi:hypothetical protein